MTLPNTASTAPGPEDLQPGDVQSEDDAPQVTVRFFAAAAEAAGADQLQVRLPAPLPTGGVAVVDLLAELPRLVGDQQSAHSPDDDAASASDSTRSGALSLERVCARSSFLINGVRTRAQSARLQPGDQLDVLPPFAGG
ncbi:MoaD/ThiS family protein [Nesterenkonia lutea]|uniref:Molybdopterin converting factor small subunit n=1 Tax=Nesterenkonia lutea TaxID=272919 RepID=A0ABR9JEJ0_9MICC|nr:MoaD/ThiS family protein [Nesterenkonia lutea]MBE1524341.1 molybdopterin converting factor small subunit [Nesterenkonia lutea]